MKNKFTEIRWEKNLRNCQLIQLELLKQLAQICQKHQLDYWIDGGTLLGAVRHKGFIPWDDDVDVAMPSEDYKTFLEVAQSELPEGLFLQTRKTDPSYPQYFAKIIKVNSLYISPGDDLSLPYQKCIFLDIFEFIEYPTMPGNIIKTLASGISFTQYFLNIKHHIGFKMLLEVVSAKIKLMLFKGIWTLCRILPKGRYISNTIEDNGYGIVHLIDSIFPIGRLEFEGEMFNCPRNADAYLKDLYGNYMELPPIEKRISHSIYIEPDLTDG